MSAQVPGFQKRIDFSDFQMKNSHIFSTVLDTSRQLKRRKTPEYRLINRYFKSPKRYWIERNRRKEAHELYSQGLTHQQIAEKLGVCAKTVSSDLKKTQRYHKGQVNSMLQKLRAERSGEYTKRYETLPLHEQRKQLSENFRFLSKILSTRKRLQSTLTFTINVDEFLDRVEGRHEYGRSFITFSPKRVNCSLSDLRLNFQFRLGDQVYPHSTLTFGG